MRILSPLFLTVVVLFATPLFAEELPVAEQNALVQKYCGVCHTDQARNGGLSLQHFDAATVPPSLAAMMLSKITGLSLDTLRAASSHSDAQSLVEKQIQGGAMNAAGVTPPPSATTLALVAALTRSATNAEQWSVHTSETGVVSASILREQPTGDGRAQMFRLTVACDMRSRTRAAQLDWTAGPKQGELLVAIDNRGASAYHVEGVEKMGNGGNSTTTGRASASLVRNVTALPKERLAASGLFATPVVFPFSTMPASGREALDACFTKTATSSTTAGSAAPTAARLSRTQSGQS